MGQRERKRCPAAGRTTPPWGRTCTAQPQCAPYGRCTRCRRWARGRSRPCSPRWSTPPRGHAGRPARGPRSSRLQGPDQGARGHRVTGREQPWFRARVEKVPVLRECRRGVSLGVARSPLVLYARSDWGLQSPSNCTASCSLEPAVPFKVGVRVWGARCRIVAAPRRMGYNASA